MISIEKGWFLLARFQQNNCVCCLESHFTSISGTCFFEANHHGRSAPQLHCTVVILCQGSKGLANPPTKDISTSRVSKFFTNKIRVLISSNFRQVTLFVADLTFSKFFSSRVTRFRECSLGDAGDFGDVGNVGVDGFGENNDDWVVIVVMVVTRVMRDSVVETFQVQSPAQPLKDHGINLETTSIGFIYILDSIEYF